MKVWVIIRDTGEWDSCPQIVRICSTEEKAISVVAEASLNIRDYDIEEWDVD